MNLYILVITFVAALWSQVSLAAKDVEFGYYRSLLIDGKYEILEQRQKQINDGYLKGEVPWQSFYPAFDYLWFDREVEEAWVKDALQAWLKKDSESPYALLNMGQFYFARGAERRGGKWRSETPEINFERMRKDFNVAAGYINKALIKKPDLLQAYRTLINIKKNYSSKKSESSTRELVERAVAYRKDNYIMWHVLLHAQKPRWGGSYELMQKTLKEIAPFFKNNRKDYNLLNGMVGQDIVDLLYKDKRMADAKDIIQRYESTGYPYLFEEKAWVYIKEKNYKVCYDAAAYALKFHPYETNLLKVAAICARKIENWAAAKEAYYRYAMIKGRGAWQLYYLGQAYMYLHEYDKAYAALKASEKLKPDYKKYTAKYTSYIEQRHPDKLSLSLESLGL